MPDTPATDAAWLRWNAAHHVASHRALLATPLPPAGPRRAYREQRLAGYRRAAARLLAAARRCDAGASALDLIPINSGLIVAAALGGRA